jgi:hypothetical protein
MEEVDNIPRTASDDLISSRSMPRSGSFPSSGAFSSGASSSEYFPSSGTSSSGSSLSKSHMPKNYSPRTPRKKFKWCDSTSGNLLTAGGILFYDEEGIWVIGEKDKNGIVYSDIGGRYTYEDGNIWATIARELREETYGVCEMFAGEIEVLSEKYPPVYINGHENKPTYACLVVPTSTLDLEKRTHFSLDPKLFDSRRLKTLSENPDVSQDYYPFILTKLTYDEIRDCTCRLSYRLKRIIRFSPVFSFKVPKSRYSSPHVSDDD